MVVEGVALSYRHWVVLCAIVCDSKQLTVVTWLWRLWRLCVMTWSSLLTYLLSDTIDLWTDPVSCRSSLTVDGGYLIGSSGHADGCRNIFIFLLALRLITGAAGKNSTLLKNWFLWNVPNVLIWNSLTRHISRIMIDLIWVTD